MDETECTDMQVFMDDQPHPSSSSESEFVDKEPPIKIDDPAVELNNAVSETTCKRSCLVLEIFSGSCRLSKACRQIGLRVTAIDKDTARAENFPVYQCDLTKSAEVALLCQYIEAEQDELLHVHFAPSCGTASRAREKAPGPPPLRSDVHPDGLPWLKPSEQERVSAANASYKAMITVAELLVSLGISFSIENPKNSLFWKCTFIISCVPSEAVSLPCL